MVNYIKSWKPNRPKEAAYDDFMEMTYESWTWQRLTDAEKENFENCMELARRNNEIFGGYKARWCMFEHMYHAFLVGLGYIGMGWRDDEVQVLSVRV